MSAKTYPSASAEHGVRGDADDDRYPPPLDDGLVYRLNEANARWSDTPVLPRLTYGQLLDERTQQIEAQRSALGQQLAASLCRTIADGEKARDEDGVVLPRGWDGPMFAEQVANRFAGEPFYVTEEMARLADVAAESLPPEITFTREMFPAPVGYIRLEQPRYTVERGGRRSGTIAFGWGPLQFNIGREERETLTGVYLMYFVHRDDIGDEVSAELTRDGSYHVFRALPYHWAHSAGLPFGFPLTQVPAWSEIAYLYALLTLMQQEVGVSVREQPDRAALRRAVRAKLPSEVTVVRLRRPRYVGEPEDGGTGMREWACRWFVRFHWRHYDHPTDRSTEGGWCPKHERVCHLVAINPFLKNAGRTDLPIHDPDRKITVLSR